MNPQMIQFGSATTGEMSVNEIAELNKALVAGHHVSPEGLSGGGALRVQSLDTVLQSTIQENKHFVLFNKIAKTKPTATVDEWTEQDKVGGFLGSTTNTETGIISEFTGSYNRRVGFVKYLMAKRQVSLVQTLQKAIAESEAIEYANGALQLLTDIEYFLFEGDEAVVSTEFSGIRAQLLAGVAAQQVDPENIIDLDGTPLNNIQPLNKASAQVRKYGNFGTITDAFWNQQVQADFDNNLDPAFRVSLNQLGGAEGGLKLGAPVTGVRTSGGVIAANEDVFVRDEDLKRPFQVLNPGVATAMTGLKPAGVAVDVSQTDASSRFTTGQGRDGTYYYAVAGTNLNGTSDAFVSGAAAVVSGRKVVLTITASAGGQETGYVIYRSRKGGTNAVADMREMVRIPKTGGTTVYTDLARDIPGATEAFFLNMNPGQHAITWRQLMPMIKFPLYPTNAAVLPWAQLIFGYLRMTKRKHHAMARNILPTNQVWKPFG